MTQKEYFIHLIKEEKGTSFILTVSTPFLIVLCCMIRRSYIIARAMIKRWIQKISTACCSIIITCGVYN